MVKRHKNLFQNVGLSGLFLFILFVIHVPAASAQSEEAQPSLLSTEAPTLRFEHLKVGDGLAQGSANYITQDSQGFI